MPFSLMACNLNPTQNAAVDTYSGPTDSTYNICYESIMDRDSVFFNALIYGDSIKGSLGYKLYEKDQNNGSVLGTIHGDTIRALYTFMSEGQESTREIIFLQEDKQLVEGYGTMEERNGRTMFKHNIAFRFDGIRLKEVNCK